MAAGADRVLDGAELFDTLADGDRRLQLRARHHRAHARSGQAGGQRRTRPPPQMAPRVAAGETVALVFGRERNGLENDEVALADAHRHAAGQSGLRLAQSGAGGGDRRL